MFTKKIFILYVIFSAILCWSFMPNLSARAAPIDKFPVTVTQPDGTKLTLFASGDEFYNWLQDAQGYTVIKNPNTGYYVYANLVNGGLVATDFVAGKTDPAAVGLQPYLNISPEQKTAIRKSSLKKMGPAGGEGGSGSLTTGTINNLAIFIRFAGEAEFTNPLSVYTGMFNDATAGANSLRNYYQEVSYNTLTINSTFYPTPAATVISYQDSHSRAYYQPYDEITNPDGYKATDNRESELLTSAINYINNLGQFPDGATIDANGDGMVDSLTFIVSGEPTAWSTLLWPHMSGTLSPAVTINGKTVSSYAFQLDAMLGYRGTGILAHEMFHVLGAPDLYHYVASGIPVGAWDLMENDLNPPQHMGCYMKYKYGKWINSIPELGTPGTYSVNPLTSPTNNCYKIASPYSTTEFFVVEYRQKTGAFESSLPGTGLLVYRINSEGYGNSSGYDEVYIYRPGGTLSETGNTYAANFSSDEGRTAINDGSDPSSFLSDGSFGGLDLCNIGAANATISFDICVGSVNIISGNAGVGGATLVYTDGVTYKTITANNKGVYAFTVPGGWTGSVTPSKTGYTFSPPNKSYTNITGNQTVQNYVATGIINLLRDPSFEAYNPVTKNNPYWVAKSTNFGTPLCTVATCGSSSGAAGPRTGTTWGWFGGITRAETSSLSQTVVIPSGPANLEFYLWISYGGASGAKNNAPEGGGGGGGATGEFSVQVDNVEIFSLNASQNPSHFTSYPSYTMATVDVSAFADGAAHTITFSSLTNGQILNYSLDNVALRSNTPRYIITGNTGVGGAILSYTENSIQKTAVANGDGLYFFSVPSGWSGTVTPSKAGYSFLPSHQSYSNVTANKPGQNYTAMPQKTIRSTGAQDGWVLESSEISSAGGLADSSATVFYLGDDAARKQYRSILSFNTGASIPDTAVITGVTLKVKQQAIIGGGNPVTTFQGLMFDVKNGFFGTAATLQASDFQAAASASYGPSTSAPIGGWYSFNLTNGKAFINKLTANSGLTQIRLHFRLDDNNDAIANYISLYSGNATLAADRPQLVITYLP